MIYWATAIVLLGIYVQNGHAARESATLTPENGGSSISGVSVSCYNSMENCLEACYMSCYFADHCNDSPAEMVACAPGLQTMVILTILFVLSLSCCCCFICFCSPCCVCAIWWKKRRNARNREEGQRFIPLEMGTTAATAPPLYPKL